MSGDLPTQERVSAGAVVAGLLGDEWACDLYTYGRDLIADL